MPTVSQYLDPLDLEELSPCEKPSKALNTTERSARSPVESKLEIEIDLPEPRSKPEFFLEKWPPECTFVSDKSSKQFLPEISLLPRYVVETSETTTQKPVMRMNNQVKKPIHQTPIKAF
ncbi:MAG: hypothetical protein GY861_11870 [bacterium]|nr:hypothetical protein [bacterium]